MGRWLNYSSFAAKIKQMLLSCLCIFSTTIFFTSIFSIHQIIAPADGP